MRIIVDANIVFSGLLNSNGKIADLLINSTRRINFIAPDFLRIEIAKHYTRLSKISNLSIDQIKSAEFQLCKDIIFIAEEQIRPSIWKTAERLVADIDPKDVHYIAFAKRFRCKLWSGDKELMLGLAKKGFKNFCTTNELYTWREQKS